METQEYWGRIQSLTESRLLDIIEQPMRDGLGSAGVARRIREQVGGSFARHRAMTIARTEAPAALNAGHVVTQ